MSQDGPSRNGQLVLIETAYPGGGPPRARTTVVVATVTRRGQQLRLRVVTDRPPEMPSTRSDCVDGPRPCPWVSCREHLWSVTDRPGRRRFGGDAPPHTVVRHSPETCALDLAERGPQEYVAIASALGLTPERARQVTEAAGHKMRETLNAQHVEQWGDGPCEDGCGVCANHDNLAREQDC